jgi:Ca2+:H+ antiporter
VSDSDDAATKEKCINHDSVALVNNHIRIVQASILGSILVNLLLILGSALLACSMADLEAVYSTQGTQLLGCLLFVSVFAFLMPVSRICSVVVGRR